MEERRSETEEMLEGEDPPGGVSNQNREEAEPGHGDGSRARAEPNDGHDRPASDAPGVGAPRGSQSPAGAAGEGTQATGHPNNAG